MSKKSIGVGITGSFCTHSTILKEIEKLVQNDYNVIPIITNSVFDTSTRFGTNTEFIEKLESVTGNAVISDIVSAEPIGPNNLIEALVIAPCTGNTLVKLANGITDNAVTMVAKSLQRNYKPVIIGISTNDALGINLKNIAQLMNIKNVYFIPFKQDDSSKKPKSLISDFSLIDETLNEAFLGKQKQPLLI